MTSQYKLHGRSYYVSPGVRAEYATIDGFLAEPKPEGPRSHERASEAERDVALRQAKAEAVGGDEALFALGTALRRGAWVAPWRDREALKDELFAPLDEDDLFS